MILVNHVCQYYFNVCVVNESLDSGEEYSNGKTNHGCNTNAYCLCGTLLNYTPECLDGSESTRSCNGCGRSVQCDPQNSPVEALHCPVGTSPVHPKGVVFCSGCRV